MRDALLKTNAMCGVAGTVSDGPALESLVSRINQAICGIKEAEELLRFAIDRLGADQSGGKPVGPQSPTGDTLLSRLREVAEFAENMRYDLHEQAGRLNRMV